MKAPGVHLRGSFYFQKTCLFANLDFRLKPARWTVLLGASGVGKSTLLRVIGGLPTGGDFQGSLVFEQEGKLSPDSSRSTTRQGLALLSYMAQGDALVPWLTLEANVRLGARLRGERVDEKRLDYSLEALGLLAHRKKYPEELSGGMKQRAVLARVLNEDQPLVLLDEPFSALDVLNRHDMQTLAARLLSGRTVLLVTHDPSEAARLGDDIMILDHQGLSYQDCSHSSPLREGESRDALARALSGVLMKHKEGRAGSWPS